MSMPNQTNNTGGAAPNPNQASAPAPQQQQAMFSHQFVINGQQDPYTVSMPMTGKWHYKGIGGGLCVYRV